jgi:hypothetical protein
MEVQKYGKGRFEKEGRAVRTRALLKATLPSVVLAEFA